MKISKLLFTILIALFTCVAFAADQAAKEDTLPPPQEGPIPIDQIPAIASMPETSSSPSQPAPSNPVSPPTQQQP